MTSWDRATATRCGLVLAHLGLPYTLDRTRHPEGRDAHAGVPGQESERPHPDAAARGRQPSRRVGRHHLVPGRGHQRSRRRAGWRAPQTLQWMFFEQYSHEPYIAVARFWKHFLRQARRRSRRWSCPGAWRRAMPRSASWSSISRIIPYLRRRPVRPRRHRALCLHPRRGRGRVQSRQVSRCAHPRLTAYGHVMTSEPASAPKADSTLEAELYDPADEHDACGVGLVVAIDGKPRREVVVAGIEALKAVWHRGAVDADGKTGDGAGIHVADPAGLLRATRCERRRRHAAAGPHRGRHGVPAAHRSSARRSAAAPSSRPRSCASATPSCGWRQVPVDISVHRREGQRDAARDRADHDRQPEAASTSDAVRARALHHPPADREAGAGREHHRLLRLLAVAAAR